MKTIKALIAAPRLALAAGMVMGILLWLCIVESTYPWLAMAFSFGCLLTAASVPCIIMGRLRQRQRPKAPYGQSLADWAKYEVARKQFETYDHDVQRLMIHWNVGLMAGFVPLLFISLTF